MQKLIRQREEALHGSGLFHNTNSTPFHPNVTYLPDPSPPTLKFDLQLD